MSLEALARAGVTLAGRLVAAHGEQVAFDNSAPANIAAGDAFAARIRAMLDQAIRRAGLDAPPVEPDDADTPIELDPPTALDLRAVAVGSVVWCTGYTGDFSWLPPALRDADGRPRHHGGGPPCPESGTSGCAGSPTAPPATSSDFPPTPRPQPEPWPLISSRATARPAQHHHRSGERP